jgi:serralysin
MATVFLTAATAATANLGTQAAFNYGVEADRVFALDNGFYSILTWEGNDYVSLTRVTDHASAHQVLLGSGNDVLVADWGVQTVVDGSGNDVYSTGADDDQFVAGLGSDRVDAGAGFDTLTFTVLQLDNAQGANPTRGVTCDLALTSAQNLGDYGVDTLLNFDAIIGTTLADRLYGNSGANSLRGDSGNDVLDGRIGNDSLVGDEGADLMLGGLGADLFACLEITKARDTIRYYSVAESGVTAAAWDTLDNFDSSALATSDVVDLLRIDANVAVAGDQNFTWRGTAAAFSLPGGEVRLKIVGPDTYICIDNDADAATEMVIYVPRATNLTQAHFIL